MADAEFDYIIVGAGSAGCVLANRLSAEPGNKVLILEAGKWDRHPWIKLPMKFRDLSEDPAFNWGYETEPEAGLDNRRIGLPRGKLVGGSSSINGMVYSRGHPSDYDQWRQMGLTGWSYADALPYFKKSEGHERGESTYHGDQGPLSVSQGDHASEGHQAYLAAGEALGYPRSSDFNGDQSEGFGPAEFTIREGRRRSSARAFLHPALRRKNLSLITHASANRIVFEGQRAVGVEYQHQGRTITAGAHREVIVTSGAYASPQMLMLSGIGPADHLAEHKIPVVLDAPGVGSNLQDHVSTFIGYRSNHPASFDPQLRLDRLTLSVIRWALFKTGPAMSIPLAGLAYVRTRPELDRPDLEMMLGVINPTAQIWFPGFRKPTGGYFGIRVICLHPESRGSVRLASSDPTARPVIRHDYFSREADLTALRDGIKTARRMFEVAPLKNMVEDEMFPGVDATSDVAIDAFIRQTSSTIFHPVGTCRMGSDTEAVVDEQLRVNGTQALRVVDASVMPNVPGGHTNAPTIMIAEKAADMILGNPPLTPAEL